MKKALVLAIFAALLVSGCIGQTPDGGGTKGEEVGLEITSFTVDPVDVFGGRTARVTMEILNKGGSNTVDDYDKATVNTNRSTGVIYLITPSDWGADSSRLFNISFDKQFRRADPVTGQEAGQDMVRWSITAPELAKGQTRTDSVIGRMYYDYSTVARGSIWVYPEAERDEAAEASSFTTTDGPVKMTISVSPDPPILSSKDEEFTLRVDLENIGTGVAYQNGTVYRDLNPNGAYEMDLSEGKNKIKLDIDAKGATIESGCTDNIELIGSTPRTTVFCDMTLKESLTTKRNIPVTITAKYGYWTEKTATVTISGR